jgi:hypothetical protein
MYRFFTNPGVDDDENLISRYITPPRNLKMNFTQNFKTIAPVFFNDYKTTQEENSRVTKPSPKGRKGRNGLAKKGNRSFIKWREKRKKHQSENGLDENSGVASGEHG